MLHRLLACFALLTGLAIAGTPALAHRSDMAHSAVEGQECSSIVAAQGVAALVLEQQGAAGGTPDDRARPAASGQPTTQTQCVLLGIDRAHE